MHQIYTTPAYVLKSYSNKEANKTLVLLTKDFGLIRVIAQGIRLEKSKHRFALQDFSNVEVSLVKGRAGWRLTSAKANSNIYQEIENQDLFQVVVRIFLLLDRLIQGEEENQDLYSIIEQGIEFILENKDKNKNGESLDVLDIECVLVLRILNNLGYIGNNKNLSFFTINNDLNNEHIEEIKKERISALSEINRALKESHL